MTRCSRSRAPGLVTRQQIAAETGHLGVEPGDTLMLHASVGSIGWIVGGPDQVLAGLLDVLRDRGTLMMYAGWDGSPYDITCGMPEVPPQLRAVWPAFDIKTSRAVREWGVLPEYLRTWEGAQRSEHPDSSFVAVGDNASELTSHHPLQYGMGAGSPLETLCTLRGKVLLLGSPLANVTLLHYAEHIAEVPDKAVVRYHMPVLKNGETVWESIEEFNTGGDGCMPWGGPVDLFEAIVDDYVKEGQGAVGPIGGATSYLFDARDLSDFAVRWMEDEFRAPVQRPDVRYELHAANHDDHRALAVLLAEADSEMTGKSIPETKAYSVADHWLECANARVFLATSQQEPIGMIIATLQEPKLGIIEHAFVQPAYRRRGVLRDLEIEASTYFLEVGCSHIRLQLDAENEVARETWRALGYRATTETMERPL